jgi:hypothetical protein
MTRVLEEPRIREHNVRLYDNNGTLLACESLTEYGKQTN